jgi:PAS domain S-box-containing protein
MARPVFAYLIAFTAVAAAVVLRWLLDPVLGNSLPLVTLFGAVAAAVSLGGYRPAIVAAVLGYLACHYLFIEPRGQIRLDNTEVVVGLIAYLFTCTLIIAIGEAMRAARTRTAARSEVLRITLGSIGDAVITTDTSGRVTYLNAVAETLTGWARDQALGQPLDRVFRIINEETRNAVENPATKALRDGVVVGLANHTLLVSKDGIERPVDDSAAPIKDDAGAVSGCVLVFRDVSSAGAGKKAKPAVCRALACWHRSSSRQTTRSSASH